MVVDELSDIKKHVEKQLAKGYTPDNIRRSLLDAGFSKSLVKEAFSGIEMPEEEEKPGFFQQLLKSKKEKPEEKKEEIKPEKPKKEEKTKKEKKKEKPKKKREPKKQGFFTKLLKPTKKTEKKPKKEKKKEKPKKKKGPKIPKKTNKEKKPLPPAPAQKTRKKNIWAAVTIVIVLFVLAAAIIFLYFAPVSCATEECFIEKANKCEQATFKSKIQGTTIYFETNNCVLTKKIISLAPEEPTEIIEAFLGKSMTCRYKMNDFNPLYITTISGLINTCDGPLRNAVLEHAV